MAWLNDLLVHARDRGVTIIHAPSDCMEAYADHPARRRALEAPEAAEYPDEITAWCSKIPAEERGVYPVDQSDGGEDDDPREHAEWAAKLKAMGRNPGTPWKKQSDLIVIDPARDYISDRGDEVWNILEQRGVRNVILTGVHTNMCVLGRPFGLRNLVRGGKNVVLMRDLTDTMYNPQRWPYVSHFTGTDLIVAHIERYVCPTVSSDQLLGGAPVRFKKDTRPHLAIVMAEDEYETNTTLPQFALQQLGRRFRVSYVHGSDTERNSIPGVDVLDSADVVLISIRRRVLPAEQLEVFRRFVAAGKPVIGLRTASHAFSLRRKSPPDGLTDWPEFDAQVFGGNYHNHHGNQLKSTVRAVAPGHPILTGLSRTEFPQGGSLYRTTPLAKGATPLLAGRVAGHPEEPVAWTFTRRDGGRSFYTSLGHKADFENPDFVRLLVNGLHWAAGLPPVDDVTVAGARRHFEQHWNLMPVPGTWAAGSAGRLADYRGAGWYRCVVRVPQAWEGGAVALQAPAETSLTAWWNGTRLTAGDAGHTVPADSIEFGDANLVVLRVADGVGLSSAPTIRGERGNIALAGRWQFRIGDDPEWSNLPLPAKFGASADIVFPQ